MRAGTLIAVLFGLGLALVAARPARAYRPDSESAFGASGGEILFFADVAASLDPGGNSRVRVSLEAPWESFRFLPRGNGFGATFEVAILVYDRGNDQLSGDNWSIPLTAPDLAEARSPNRVWLHSFELPAAPGKLRCEVRLTQMETGHSGAWSGRVNVPDYAARTLALSDLLLGRCVEDSAEADPAFPGFRFLPGARRRFGDSQPVLCAYGEIYDHLTSADTAYAVTYDVIAAGGRKLETWTEAVPRRAGRGRYCLHPSVASLKLGNFTLRVEARAGGQKARVERFFQVDAAALDPLENPNRLRSLIGYIAGAEELVQLESTPNDSLPGFWSRFWQKRDPTPGTLRNESRDEFLRRVEYADTHFNVLEAGWNSDMGRIYIRFGPPDQIDRAPMGTTSQNQEIWHYLIRNLRFVFVDTEGFGRFRLVGSDRG